MKIKKRNFLKNKKVKEIKNNLSQYEEIIPKKAKVELVKIEDLPEIYLVDDEPLLMQSNDEIIPTLKAALKMDIDSKYATVDQGAINFVIKGADIMSPGIVEADETITPGETIIVLDDVHRKPLAIGTSLITGQEMMDNDKGKAIKNLHYVGDTIWNLDI